MSRVVVDSSGLSEWLAPTAWSDFRQTSPPRPVTLPKVTVTEGDEVEFLRRTLGLAGRT